MYTICISNMACLFGRLHICTCTCTYVHTHLCTCIWQTLGVTPFLYIFQCLIKSMLVASFYNIGSSFCILHQSLRVRKIIKRRDLHTYTSILFNAIKHTHVRNKWIKLNTVIKFDNCICTQETLFKKWQGCTGEKSTETRHHSKWKNICWSFFYPFLHFTQLVECRNG